MPIDDDEWESGRSRDTTEQRVLGVLKNNQDKAFTAYEIAQSLNRVPQTSESDELGDLLIKGIAGGLSTWSVENALESLVDEGEVGVRTIEERIGEKDYYRIVQ